MKKGKEELIVSLSRSLSLSPLLIYIHPPSPLYPLFCVLSVVVVVVVVVLHFRRVERALLVQYYILD